mgnify:FL=1|tara:strand:+ start:2762 stop:3496 length:735 start_codon:yes stop_codon:yes gene_type:complete
MPQIYEVGGCVRDEIIGVHTNDIDFTFVLDNTDQTVDEGWDEMLSHLKTEGFKIFLETKDCFTVRAKFPKGHVNEGLVADFVMARKEVGYILGTRKPILELGTLEDDLRRRDFTLNALAKDLDGTIVDLFEGKKHLEEGILVTPLNPIKTFFDDPLRMIRALRFSITKGFEIDPEVWDAMFEPGLIEHLKNVVSKERIQGEVSKMMKHDTVSTLRLLAKIDKIEPKLLEVMFGGDIWLLPSTKK